MKSSLIAILLLLGCAYGAYDHIQEQESRIAASEKIRESAEKETRAIMEEEKLLRPKLEESEKLLAKTRTNAAAEALELERKARQELHASLKAEIAETSRRAEVAGAPRVNPADAEILANIAALEAAIAKFNEENVRLAEMVRRERAAMPVSQR